MDLLFAKAPGDVDYHSESRGDLFVSREPDKAAKIEFHLSSLGIRGKSTGELFSDEMNAIAEDFGNMYDADSDYKAISIDANEANDAKREWDLEEASNQSTIAPANLKIEPVPQAVMVEPELSQSAIAPDNLKIEPVPQTVMVEPEYNQSAIAPDNTKIESMPQAVMVEPELAYPTRSAPSDSEEPSAQCTTREQALQKRKRESDFEDHCAKSRKSTVSSSCPEGIMSDELQEGNYAPHSNLRYSNTAEICNMQIGVACEDAAGEQDDAVFWSNHDIPCSENVEPEHHVVFEETNKASDGANINKSKGRKRRTINRNAREVTESRRQKQLREQMNRAEANARKANAKLGNDNRKPSGNGDPFINKLLRNLVASNPFAERMAHGDILKGSKISGKHKGRQLQDLLNDVPGDYGDKQQANADKNALEEASKRFGFANIVARDGHWLMKGMTSPLLHHQLLAAKWMVDRELSLSEPYGGIQADAMGLGKTVMMLATMVGNRPSDEEVEKGQKATLIVVPSSAVKQWMDEIKKHVSAQVFSKVIAYKASSGVSTAILEDSDIVVASYQEVMASMPYPTKSDPDSIEDAKQIGMENWIAGEEDNRGPLHRINWYRIVLDEAHAIKNHRSRTSLACTMLDGKFRWAVTGTPIMNSLDELYPYFRFLRCYKKDIREFKAYFGQSDEAWRRLGIILPIIMLRRTVKDKILGRPIVDLPKCHQITIPVVMSKGEQIIYRMIEDKFRDRINAQFRNETSRGAYGVQMTELLRLRQATAHPFLLERCFKSLLNAQDLLKLKSELSALENSQPAYEQIEQWVIPETNMKSEEAIDEKPFRSSDFGKHFKMGPFLDEMDEKAPVCGLCEDLPEHPVITNCKHVFCLGCLEGEVHMQAAASRTEFAKCATCQEGISGVGPFNHRLIIGDDEEPQARNVENALGKRETTAADSWLKLCIANEQPLLPSAKIIALKSQLLKWFNEAPDDKILVFSQFRMVLRIVGLLCQQENWGYTRFTGDMNAKQRGIAVDEFHENHSVRIMLASLKCGGQAINLTCANRCVNLDLWWNHSVEQQAFGRIFRIGQHKETHFTRIVCRNTVDERMLKMQDEKESTLEKAMQNSGERHKPLTLDELARLFGTVTMVDGVKQVVPDYYEDEHA